MSPILLLGQLLTTTGEICGRKKLQKIVHLLQTLKGVPFGYSFQFSFFGPYSADLKADVGALTAEGLLLEHPETTPQGNKTYRFTADPRMAQLLSDVSAPAPDGWNQLATNLNARSAEELEGISTLLFLQKMGWAGEDLKEQFGLLKPRLKDGFAKYEVELSKLAA